MKIGLLTPVLSLVPGNFSDWEIEGTIDDVRRIAGAADRLGFDYLTCSQHVAIPTSGTDLPGPRYWDPLPTFGYLAGATSNIRFATSVLVLPYHHPLQIAKEYGTLDRICGGRLILGMGVGYLEQEFDLLGVPFHDRGERADDAIRALRASFGRREPEYHGPFFDFQGMIVDPHGVQERPPMWVGGRSRRSLRRAVELADGWCPFAVSLRDIAAWLDEAAGTDAWHERPEPLEVIVSRGPLDPMGDPDKTAEIVHRAREAGATGLSIRLVHESPEQCIEQLEAMAELAVHL